MKKLQLVICAVLVGAIVAAWILRERTKLEWQKQSELQTQMRGQVGELRAENDRLTSQIAKAENGGKEQLSELLRLRAEVTRLRQQTNELRALRSQNEQLLRERKESVRQRATSVDDKPKAPNTPPDVPAQDIHPREAWNYVGYDTPDAAVQSMLWASAQTNREVFLAGFSAEMRAKFEKDLPDDALFKDTGTITGFRVLDRKFISDSEMDVTIYIEGDKYQDTTRFKKIDGRWKVAGEPK